MIIKVSSKSLYTEKQVIKCESLKKASDLVEELSNNGDFDIKVMVVACEEDKNQIPSIFEFLGIEQDKNENNMLFYMLVVD